MKVCEICGDEFDGRDGENTCASCERRDRKKKDARRARKEREAAYRSCGLVKVRGALGGVYWE